MTEQEIFETVASVIRDSLDNDDLAITMETTADDVPDWDSANHINIVLSIEQRFKIKFKTAEIEELRDVGGLVKLVKQKTG